MAEPDSDSKAKDYARDRIAALMEDSDSDGDAGDWYPKLTAIPSSSQDKQVEPLAAVSYDISLDDEDVVPFSISSPPAASSTVQDDGEDDDGSAAYARMMKSMLKPKTAETAAAKVAEKVAEKAPASMASSPKQSPVMQAQASDSSEEEMPVKKTVRRQKRASSSSPARPSSPPLPRTARSPSPTLFVSPARSQRALQSPTREIRNDSDSDGMPTTTVPRSRFQELVAKKRAEREAKEQAEREKAQAARKQESEKQKKLAKQYKEIYSSELDDGMTEDAQKVLEESSRPAQRKASKKALEEMNRETQRMARNQQLTHQARVKRKITTLDFVKSFGMAVSDSDDRPQSRGALVSSDNEVNVRKDTPPSSPPSVRGSQDKVKDVTLPAVDEEEYIIRTGPQVEGDDEELPDIDQLLSEPTRFADKGKGKAVPSSPPQMANTAQVKAKLPRKQIRVSAPPKFEDSDDDLEIVTTKKPSRFAIFDKLPEKNANEPKSLLNLRNLAHMSPPAKNNRHGRHSMTAAQLHVQLVQQMHKQTVADKQERIDALRAKGIEFKTEEEMEEDQLYIENMLEKARKEAMELGLKEKEAAKKNGEDIDENYALPSEDEDEDAEYDEEDEDEDVDVEMSGSEEEDAAEEEESAERTGLFDDAAEEADDDDEEEEAEAEDGHEDAVMDDAPEVEAEADDENAITVQKSRSKPRNRNVVLDDDEDDDEQPAKPPTPTVAARTSTQTSPINAFGFAMPNADLSLTQMFKGTLEELATQDNATQATPARSLDFLRDAPAPTLPSMSPPLPPAGLLVPSSQTLATPSKQRPGVEGTPQFTPHFPTPARVGSQMSPTKLSEIPEPTQDAGFDNFPATRAEQPYSTIDTVMMPVAESPVALKKGKLRRRAQKVAELSDDEDVPAAADDSNEGDFELTTNAFDALFKAAKKPAQVETFDKKRSEAKAMFEEQAEESEDEYAGLGGASDDESDNGVDEEVQKMIDEGPVDVKEGELAKLFADRDRADDEKRIDRLYKDITTGALRRKRGVGVDELSDDSDDEAAERRRRKQAEFRKMRQALLLDENVGKIAENPKKSAFLKAIEDRDEDDGIDYLGEMEEASADSQVEGTQDEQAAASQAEQTTPAEAASASLKRKLPDDFATNKDNARPDMSHRRRPAADHGFTVKPVGIAELRESISMLIDEPLVPNSQVSDASDDEEEDEPRLRQRRNDGNGSAVLTAVRASVINRLTVSRQNSMDTEDGETSGPVAFHTSTSSVGMFKIPSLLRRATTNLSNASTSSTGTTTPTTTTGNNENAVRMGGSKKSNIHFQAREAERMKKVRDVEERRREGIRKSVVGKGRVSVLGNSLGRRGSGFE